MKNKGITILLIITNIILIAILCSFIRINGNIIKEKQIIKEMSESTQVTDLNNQINALNTEHTEYMNYIQRCKAQLASAITDMGVETSENANIDAMVNNIRSITGSSDIAFGNTGTMVASEVKTIELDFTPDFALILSQATVDSYRRVSRYWGIAGNNLSTEDLFASDFYGGVVNGDTYYGMRSNSDGNYVQIIEDGIKITDTGYGASNVFWIAAKCKK